MDELLGSERVLVVKAFIDGMTEEEFSLAFGAARAKFGATGTFWGRGDADCAWESIQFNEDVEDPLELTDEQWGRIRTHGGWNNLVEGFSNEIADTIDTIVREALSDEVFALEEEGE